MIYGCSQPRELWFNHIFTYLHVYLRFQGRCEEQVFTIHRGKRTASERCSGGQIYTLNVQLNVCTCTCICSLQCCGWNLIFEKGRAFILFICLSISCIILSLEIGVLVV